MWYAYEAQGTLIFKDTYREYNKAFYEAMIGPLKVEAAFDMFQDTAYWEKYMLNAFQFSAAKSLSEMKMLQSYVFGDNGKKVSFEDFKEAARSVVQTFNETWLRVEYDLASRGAVMADRWQEMWKDRDLFPTWIFRTRRDSRVRPEHADLEGKVFRLDDPYAQQFWPPLDWNCRCEGEQSDEPALNKAQMEPLAHNIAPGFEGNVGIDGIFPKTKSSYFDVLKNANAAKPGMFKEPDGVTKTDWDELKNTNYSPMLKNKYNDFNKDLINSYTALVHKKLNSDLSKPEIPIESQKMEKALNKALDTMSDYKGTVHRGVRLNEEQSRQLVEAFKNRGEFSFKAFTSTSLNEKIAYDFSGKLMLEIESKTGKIISEVSHEKIEQEVLFKSRTKFKFISSKEVFEGKNLEYVLVKIKEL